jgi:6-phosphofructokinase 2
MPSIATLTMNPALDVTTRVDEVRPVHKLRCGEPRFDPGGGGINVARVVHGFGGEVTAVFPSGGPVGATLEALLVKAGVPIAGGTRESLTVDEEQSGKQFRFVLPGPTLDASEQESVLDALLTLPGKPAYVVASGSLPPGCPADFYKRLARKLPGATRLVIDTSGDALAACEGAGAFLLKPSLSELSSLAGHAVHDEAEQVSAAQSLVRRGFAEAVLVSLAERGALLATADVVERVAAIEVDEASAVGAGDAMVAAVVLALSQGADLKQAVRHGIAAGAAALLTPGTALARREDYERLYAAMAG